MMELKKYWQCDFFFFLKFCETNAMFFAVCWGSVSQGNTAGCWQYVVTVIFQRI